MRKVKSCDPLRIAVKAWNEFVDAAELVESLQRWLANTGRRVLTDRDVVLVRNASSGDLASIGVLSIVREVAGPVPSAR